MKDGNYISVLFELENSRSDYQGCTSQSLTPRQTGEFSGTFVCRLSVTDSDRIIKRSLDRVSLVTSSGVTVTFFGNSSNITTSYLPYNYPLVGGSRSNRVFYDDIINVSTYDFTEPTWNSGSTEILFGTRVPSSGNFDYYTSITYSWPSATDNIGIIGYKLYLNDDYVTTVDRNTLSYQFTNQFTIGVWELKVIAIDYTGNESESKVHIVTIN